MKVFLNEDEMFEFSKRNLIEYTINQSELTEEEQKEIEEFLETESSFSFKHISDNEIIFALMNKGSEDLCEQVYYSNEEIPLAIRRALKAAHETVDKDDPGYLLVAII